MFELDKDCIQLKDGSWLCYNRETGVITQFTKKDVAPTEISSEIMYELMKKVAE
jgi:hypothetical protein